MNSLTEYLVYFVVIVLGVKIGIGFLSYFYNSFLARPLNVKKMGQWALVTGSTDGIGQAYAEALAKRGLDIILVSRTPFKLQNVAANIENKFKVRTRIIDVDFCGDEREIRHRLKSELKGLEIGVLINNVGMSYEFPQDFLDLEEDFARKIVACNINSVNVMTRLVLPQMVDRKRGAVVNISSFSGAHPTPLLSMYSATKAYIDYFSQGLNYEYGPKGITIQCVLPGFVVSKMSGLRRASFAAPTPEVFVKSALNRLGIQSRTSGYWFHDLMSWFMDLLPDWLQAQIIYGQLEMVRNKALKKKSR